MHEPELSQLDMATYVLKGKYCLLVYRRHKTYIVGNKALDTLADAYALVDSLPDGERNMDIMNELWMPFPKPWPRT